MLPSILLLHFYWGDETQTQKTAIKKVFRNWWPAWYGDESAGQVKDGKMLKRMMKLGASAEMLAVLLVWREEPKTTLH